MLPFPQNNRNLNNRPIGAQLLITACQRGLVGAFFSLLLYACLCPEATFGQAVAEAGALTSGSAGVIASKTTTVPAVKTPQELSKSQHLLVAPVQHPEIANRQALEQKAGKTPGKLLLRSTPSGAQVFVNGLLVGSTPLLLVVAPGKYEVELRGTRMEHGAQSVDLLPNETRVVSLTLSARYPTRATVR